MYDTIIIGAGPAGMTAAIYAARREMKTLVIGREIGGQVAWASEIENYPGFKTIANYDLILKMKEQVESIGVQIKNETVVEIKKQDQGFVLKTKAGEYEAKTVIVAMGLEPRKLGVDGEDRLLGKGICYCANCDGPLYRNKVVMVAGGGNAALDAAEILSKIATKVCLVNNQDKLNAFETVIEKVKERDNVEIFLDHEIKELAGENKLEKVKIADKKSGEEKELAVDGLFVEIGRMAKTDLVADFVKRDERDQILVDEFCRTNTEGLFAAGDVTQVGFKQITIACGQATIAALSAYQYLQMKK